MYYEWSHSVSHMTNLTTEVYSDNGPYVLAVVDKNVHGPLKVPRGRTRKACDA